MSSVFGAGEISVRVISIALFVERKPEFLDYQVNSPQLHGLPPKKRRCVCSTMPRVLSEESRDKPGSVVYLRLMRGVGHPLLLEHSLAMGQPTLQAAIIMIQYNIPRDKRIQLHLRLLERGYIKMPWLICLETL